MKMPFGKHRGEEIEDIPTEYLQWAVRAKAGNNHILIERMKDELDARGEDWEEEEEKEDSQPPPEQKAPPQEAARLHRIISSLNEEVKSLREQKNRITEEYAQYRQAHMGAGEHPDVTAVVRSWYRLLAVKFHPDKTHEQQSMKVINEAHELLKKLLAEQGVKK